MRRALLAALALAALSVGATAVRAPLQRIDRRLWRIFDNGASNVVAADAPLVLAYQQSWTIDNAALPDCTGDATCVALCYSTGSAWTCIDHSGATLNTVTQGTGTTYAPIPWSSTLSTMTAITDTSAPTVSATALNTVYGSDHTVVIGGYGKDLNAADFQYFLDQFSATGGLYVRQESGVMSCLWCGDSFGTCTNRQAGPIAPARPRDGWFTTSCRRSGNTYTARTMGGDGTPATVSIGTFGSDSKTGYFGRREAAGFPLQGPLAFVAWYSTAKTPTQLDALDSRFWGSGTIAGGLPSLRFIDYDGGTTEAINSNAKPVSSAGLVVTRALTNVWGAAALHADGTAAVGTPTITPDAGPGPFDNWYGRGQTCARVVDDSASFEGSESATAGTTDGLYTMSAYLAVGDAGTTVNKARLSVVATGGTGSADCDVTIAPGPPTRYRCTASIAGASAIKGRVLVGNAAADQGSIELCHAQFEAHGFPTEPTVSNAAVGDGEAYLTSADLASWPSGANRGAVEIVFTPGMNFGAANVWDGGSSIWATGSEVFDNDDTFYLFDTVNATPDHQLIMWWPGNQTKAFARLQANDGGVNEVSVAQTLYKGQQYVERMAWTTSGGLCSLSLYLDTCADYSMCHATTLIAGPGALGSCPGGPYDTAYFMRRYSNQFPTNGYLKAIRVYQ